MHRYLSDLTDNKKYMFLAIFMIGVTVYMSKGHTVKGVNFARRKLYGTLPFIARDAVLGIVRVIFQ